MIMKSAIAAHVALLKKHAAMAAPTQQVQDPNEAAIQAAKEEASRKKALADIAVERSNADLATAKAANTVQTNAMKKEELAAAQPQPMPAAPGGAGQASATPGMPNMNPPAQPMAGGTMNAGSWGVQPYKPTSPGRM